MLYRNRWIATVVTITSLQLLLCQQYAESAQKEDKHAKVEFMQEKGVSRVTLSESAAKRLGITTTEVSEQYVTRQIVVGGVVEQSNSVVAPVVIRVQLSESELGEVEVEHPARILPLGREDEAVALTAREIEMANDDESEDEILFFALDSEDHGLDLGERVRVELTLEGSGKVRKIVPYASVFYDIYGGSWIYTNPNHLAYVRQKVDVDYIDGDTAVLKEGPPLGTTIVTAGVAEILGIETGVGK